MYKNVLLKLSGEALKGGSELLYDVEVVNSIAEDIREAVNAGASVSIVVGGGNIWRGAEAQQQGMKRTVGDRMGMLATVMNGIFLKDALVKLGIETIVYSAVEIPSMVDMYIQDNVEKTLGRAVQIFVGGTGSPFFTTDTASSLRASQISADVILMAKNGTDGVYDKDPNKFNDAVKYDTLTMSEIVENKLGVMDLTAATMCMTQKIDAVVFDMNVKGNILKAIKKENIGTIITN